MSRSTFADDAKYLGDKLKGHGGTILAMDAQTMMSLVGALQLSFRHPQFPAQTHAHLRPIVDRLIEQLARGDERVRELLKRGDNSKFDVPPWAVPRRFHSN